MPTEIETSSSKVLVTRCCRSNRASSHDPSFIWPESGPVALRRPEDWDPTPQCGGGLHGWLWGKGDSRCWISQPDDIHLVVEVEGSSLVDLVGKVTFPRGNVVFCGDDFAHATAGYGGDATAGDNGHATAGYYGTAQAGNEGTATAGSGGTISITYWDGIRFRILVGYVGESGIEADVTYQVIDGNLEKVGATRS